MLKFNKNLYKLIIINEFEIPSFKFTHGNLFIIIFFNIIPLYFF